MKKITEFYVGTFVILSLICVYPVIAFAQGSPILPTGSAGGDILMTIVEIALTGLSLVGIALLVRIIGYFEKKTKIDIPAATEKMLFDWADQAIGLAHEKAHQVLQDQGKVLGGNEKLNVALQFILDIANKYNLADVAKDKLEDYINAKLGSRRMDDTGLLSPPNDTVVVAK